MTRDRTHELKIYANGQHKTAQAGDLILHLWFVGGHVMELDLDIALHRPDVAYVDVVDCKQHTTKRLYPGERAPAFAKPERKKRKA
jgi:hypothetical protein